MTERWALGVGRSVYITEKGKCVVLNDRARHLMQNHVPIDISRHFLEAQSNGQFGSTGQKESERHVFRLGQAGLELKHGPDISFLFTLIQRVHDHVYRQLSPIEAIIYRKKDI